MARLMSFQTLRMQRTVGLAWKHTLRSSQSTAAPPPYSAKTVAASPSLQNFLKYTFIAAITGSTVLISYGSYAYSLEEIEEKTKAFRELAKQTTIGNVDSVLSKGLRMAYSTTLPAIELYLGTRTLIERNIRIFTEPCSDKLLPDLHPHGRDTLTLVLDLEDTLIYYVWNAEESLWDPFKRPGVDAFLEHLTQLYEIVVYADEQSLHVDAVIDKLDVNHCIAHRLSRSATKYQNGKRFRDLSKLNRDQARVIYLSAYALENCLQHENCVQIKPCKKQKHDIDDTTLLDFIPFLESVALSSPADVRAVLQSYQGLDIPTEFIRRSKEQQQRVSTGPKVQ